MPWSTAAARRPLSTRRCSARARHFPSYLAEEGARQLEGSSGAAALSRGRERAPVEGRTAILVDDGIATGATMEAAVQATRRAHPRRLVLAVPVAPPDTIAALRPQVDEVVCLATPRLFAAIGAFYEDFRQLERPGGDRSAATCEAVHATPDAAP